MQKKVQLYRLLLILLLIALVVISLFVGAYNFENSVLNTFLNLFTGSETISTSDHFVLFQLRMPRIIMAILIGSALAVAGTCLQGMFKNPLASPDLIGITSGAVLFAAVTIVLGASIRPFIPEALHYSLISIMAFVGAILTMSFVYKMSTTNGRTNVVILLLSGVAITALTGAATGMLTYLSTDEELRNLTFWTLGSLAGANWTKNLVLAVVVIIGLFFLVGKGKALNAMMLGERDAQHLGIDVEKTKKQIVIFSALMVGTAVSFAGTIGFVGLIVPYILRLLFKSNYTIILPLSIILGSIIMVLADTISRVIVQPAELPIGILTAIMGAPVFIAILIRFKKTL